MNKKILIIDDEKDVMMMLVYRLKAEGFDVVTAENAKAADDPLADYKTIQQELEAYGQGLAERPQIIAFNKIDSSDEEILEMVISELKELTSAPIFTISAVTRKGLDTLLPEIWRKLESSEILV